MQRRGFIQDLVAGLVLLGAGFLAYGISRSLSPGRASPERNNLRPPGALKNDIAFTSACIGCGLCGELCPPRCIRFHSRDGGLRVNTPYIDPGLRACTLFEKCMDVCPTEALTVTPRNEIDMGLAQIDRAACFP